MEPRADISHLPRADGSATFSYGGYAVIGSANGPMEVSRRDEDPFQAVVDVVVRPAAGVGGTRERHLEMTLRSTLAQLVAVKDFPRSLVQVTLQVTETPQDEYANSKLVQAHQNLPLLPALLHTAILALLSASVPLYATATAALVAVSSTGRIFTDPTPTDIRSARSLHVLAFSSRQGRQGREPNTKQPLILALSEGSFSPSEWEAVGTEARRVCCGEDVDKGEGRMKKFLRAAIEDKISLELAWRK